MNKKIIISIMAIIIICIVGAYLYDMNRTLTLNDYFDTSGNYKSEWNNNSKEIMVQKEFPLKFNQTWDNVTTTVSFYKNNQLLKSISDVNSTENGKLVVEVTTKLSAEPDNIEFDIIEGDIIYSDVEGIEFGENFHWFK